MPKEKGVSVLFLIFLFMEIYRVLIGLVVLWRRFCSSFDRMRRHYARQEDSSDGAAVPDGSIVEPAQIHRVMSPPVSYSRLFFVL